MNTDITIMVADDSAFMRQILCEILRGMGFSHIVECSDGKECLERFPVDKPDLILLDMIMPELDGMEVLKKIGHMTNVLVISAVGQDKMMEEARALGARGYIVKPFDNNQVVQEVARVLEESR